MVLQIKPDYFATSCNCCELFFNCLRTVNAHINPNKAGLFEGSFSWEGVQFDPPLIFQEELIQFQYDFTQLLTIYLKYVESEKMLTSSVIS